MWLNSSVVSNFTCLYNYVPLYYHIHMLPYKYSPVNFCNCISIHIATLAHYCTLQFQYFHVHCCNSHCTPCTLMCTVLSVFSSVLLLPCALLQALLFTHGYPYALFLMYIHVLRDTRTSVCHILLHQYTHVLNCMKASMCRCAGYMEHQITGLCRFSDQLCFSKNFCTFFMINQILGAAFSFLCFS